jgi:hypothetical protein
LLYLQFFSCKYCVAVLKTKFTHVQDHAFVRSRFLGTGKDSALLGWLVSYGVLYQQINLPVWFINVIKEEYSKDHSSEYFFKWKIFISLKVDLKGLSFQNLYFDWWNLREITNWSDYLFDRVILLWDSQLQKFSSGKEKSFILLVLLCQTSHNLFRYHLTPINLLQRGWLKW